MSGEAMRKFETRADAINSLVCVGLDANIARIPAPFVDDKYPQFAFNKHIIEQTHEYVVAYKPNIAFYEARGADGLRELQMTMNYLNQQHPDIFTICDAKRADIGNTNKAYVQAVFEDMQFDAVTLHPYLGQEALEPFLERDDKMCIILCRTSNTGSGEFQDLEIDGKPLWQVVAQKVVHDWNKHDNCMLVVGATYPEEMKVIRSLVGDMTLLVPGIGVQGGNIQMTVTAGINSKKKGIIVNSSRGIIFAPDPKIATHDLRDAINQYR